MVIFKYTLAVTDVQELEMPEGAQLLTVQVQNGEPQLWALVDRYANTVTRRIVIYGTGHEVHPDPGTYVATFQQAGGALVWHVFDRGERL